MSAAEVDQAVSSQVGSGLSLYTLDEARIAELAPDLVVTQEPCPVPAVSTEQVDGAVHLSPAARRSSLSIPGRSRTSLPTSVAWAR